MCLEGEEKMKAMEPMPIRGCGHQPGRALCDITKLPHFLVCVLPGRLTDRIETRVNVGGKSVKVNL